MTSRLLVTGSTGFVGTWALRWWAEHHPDVELWGLSDRAPRAGGPPHEYQTCDLLDLEAVRDLVDSCRPTHVIHLAGLITGSSLTDLLSVNVVGTENLYGALLELPDAAGIRVLQASSAAVYGEVGADQLPITEQQIPRPIGPYAISKLTQDHLALSLARTRGLRLVIARMFNTLGPGQPDTLVPMTFVRQLADVRAGRGDRLRVGRTDTRRDFVDVRDVVRAFDLLLEVGEPGSVYNVGRGQDVSIQEVIDEIIAVSGLQVQVEPEASRRRKGDVSCVRSDVSRLAALGWRPKFELSRSLGDMWKAESPG